MLRDVIILAGGFGTRIQKISKGVAKPLMPVGDRVFIDYVYEWLNNYNIGNITLSLHYSPEQFLDYLKGANGMGNVTTVIEPEPLGTGGAIRYVLDNTEVSDTFFVINGDTLLDIDLALMQSGFESSAGSAMIALTSVPDTHRYGEVCFHGNLAESFSEKVSNGAGWINSGCYLLSKEIFNGFNGVFSLEKDLFPKLVQQKKLYVHKAEGSFVDIGVPEDYYKFKDSVTQSDEGF